MSASWLRRSSGRSHEADEKQHISTDDYSNVLGAVYRRLRDGGRMILKTRTGRATPGRRGNSWN